MPTATGLPKAGEVWERRWSFPPDWTQHWCRFRVVERTRGDYWALRVVVLDSDIPESTHAPWARPRLWVDCAYHFSRGEYRYVGE